MSLFTMGLLHSEVFRPYWLGSDWSLRPLQITTLTEFFSCLTISTAKMHLLNVFCICSIYPSTKVTERVQGHFKAKDRDLIKRRKVIELLGQGQKYYDSLYDEAEIVATANSNFSKMVEDVAAKLAEQQEGLGLVPSPAQAGDITRKVQ